MKPYFHIAALAASILLVGCGADEAPSAPAAAPTMPDSETMADAMDGVAGMAASAADAMSDAATAAAVLGALAGDHRSEGNRARDIYRHPLETLTFFGIKPDSTVVEVWPGGGSAWYTEVLAPTLSEGRLIAAGYGTEGDDYFARAGRAFAEKLAAAPEVYANVESIDYQDPASADMGAPGSADAVLLFRLYHNAISSKVEGDIMADAFAVLKPGGVLGVVQHRSPEDAPAEIDRRDGYVKVSKVVADAQAAGFVLADESEVNANPADTHEHAAGVWTLPPSLDLCDADGDATAYAACVAEYRAIGESDRMTLKFVKPAA